MASQNNRVQPTFTIEQIELIRRLRNSGLTKEQVVQAFESFERVDAELGNLYTVPTSLAFPKSFTTAVSQNNTLRSVLAQPPTVTSHLPVTSEPVPVKPPSPPPVPTTVHVNRRFQGIRRSRELGTESSGAPDKVANGEVKTMSMQDLFPQAKVVKLYHTHSDEDMSQRVDEFLSQGTEKMYEEIRDFFVANPNFTQNDMASAAGVGVTCVSKFLVGNLSALSPQVLRPLCQWFLTMRMQHSQALPQQEQLLQQQSQVLRCTNSTSKMLRDIVQERLNGTVTPPEAGSSNSSMNADRDVKDVKPVDILSGSVPIPTYPEGLDVQFTPRRERFTFRKKHLEVLEAYFKTNQYPTYEERTDIAQRCNDIMEAVAGRSLGEKERMTAQNVAYWFSNRRKDIKRIAREGGIDMAEVILPSRVRNSPTILTDNSAAAAASWAIETSGISYLPLEAPGVGPVAFPAMRGVSETGSALDNGSQSSDSQSGSETHTVHIKQEPVDFEAQSVLYGTPQGRGSAVNKIAADISSQLMSAVSSLTSTSASDTQADVGTVLELKQQPDTDTDAQDGVSTAENEASGST